MSTAESDPRDQPTDTPLLLVRPRRIVRWATVSASVIFVVSVTVGILLRRSADGIAFQTSDQIGVIGMGVILSATIMIAAARPRLIVTEQGLRIRNMVGRRDIPWALVHQISFPEGAQWPLLQLADDETYPVVAIQAMDRERALVALKALRAVFEKCAPSRPQLSPAAIAARDEAMRRHEAERPLGRLEIQDLQRAAKRNTDRAAARSRQQAS